MSDRLYNLQCRIGDALGLGYCMCCGRWHRKSRMDKEINGLCHHCGTFVWFDRLATSAGLRRA